LTSSGWRTDIGWDGAHSGSKTGAIISYNPRHPHATAAAMSPELKPGIRYRFSYTVPDDKTVPHLYPEFAEFREMPAVLATGFMVGLIEGACQLAIKPYLDWPREQSLGTHVDFTHESPTPPGLTVTVDCEVVAVEGRRVRFRATAHDGHDLISQGSHERVVIDVARFTERVARKKPPGRGAP
jgi:fluoroacetyl-CoA thioesterase